MNSTPVTATRANTIDFQNIVNFINGTELKIPGLSVKKGSDLKSEFSRLSKDQTAKWRDSEFIVIENAQITLPTGEQRAVLSGSSAVEKRGLIFVDCSIAYLVVKEAKLGAVLFLRCEIKNLIIDKCQTSLLSFRDCSIQYLRSVSCVIDVATWNNGTTGNIEFANAIYGKVTVINLTAHNVRISSCITGEVKFSNSTTGYVYFDKCRTGPITIEHCHLTSFYVTYNQCSIYFRNSSFNQVELNHCNTHILSLESGNKAELSIIEGTINCLQLKCVLYKDNILSVDKAGIYSIDIADSAIYGSLALRRIYYLPSPMDWSNDVGKHAPDGFDEMREKRLGELEVQYRQSVETELADKNPVIRLKYSNLGKSEVSNSDLSGFDVEYCNCNVSDVFLMGTKMPEKELVIADTTDELQKHEQRHQLFSQLKKALGAQGDNFLSNYYNDQIYRYREKILEARVARRKTSSARFDLITFKMNKASNEHGENWGKSLRFILIACAALSIPLALSGRYLFCPELLFNAKGYSFFSFENLENAIKFFMVQLNPTRGLDVNQKITGVVRLPIAFLFWDMLSRLIVSYGIYQFISAFRKNSLKVQ